MRARRFVLGLLVSAAAALTLASCGSGEEADPAADSRVAQQPEAAAAPTDDVFPQTKGRSLNQLAREASAGPQFAPATATFVPGTNRVAFGLVSSEGEFIYAPTAVYVARRPNGPARGPFLAPAESLLTEAPYRSKNAAVESDPVASVYAADVDLPKPGTWSVLTLSDTEAGLIGAGSQVQVKKKDPIPGVGDEPPAGLDTDVVDEVGDISRIDTRVPPDSMHETEFADVVGERPVALLFATPALCESRVCGPVADIAEQLKDKYGGEVEFIHQEVYVENDPSQGLRPPLRAFNLHSEPWLFTFDAEGRIAARLEGSFGVEGFEAAIQRALG